MNKKTVQTKTKMTAMRSKKTAKAKYKPKKARLMAATTIPSAATMTSSIESWSLTVGSRSTPRITCAMQAKSTMQSLIFLRSSIKMSDRSNKLQRR